MRYLALLFVCVYILVSCVDERASIRDKQHCIGRGDISAYEVWSTDNRIFRGCVFCVEGKGCSFTELSAFSTWTIKKHDD